MNARRALTTKTLGVTERIQAALSAQRNGLTETSSDGPTTRSALLVRGDRSPRLHGDAEDDDGDDQADDRICDTQTGGDRRGARDDGQAHQPVDTRMVAVRDERGAVQAHACLETDPSGHLVPMNPIAPATANAPR